MTSQHLTRDLCAFAAGLRTADLDPVAVTRANAAIADTVGCILGGIQSKPVGPVLALALEEGGSPQSSVLGTAHRLPATAAALVNGMAGHSLDFDDISGDMYGHASVVLVPALFAVAEKTGARGDAIVCAYVAGFETAAAIGRSVNPAHYDRGWHATSTIGSLAAAVAVARLLELPAQSIEHAMGIAASQAAGTHRQFGTDVKPMHAGLAARAGVQAALLAARGMTGAAEVLDGSGSFGEVYGGAGAGVAGSVPANDDLALVRRGIQVKRHSCCAATHTSIDAMLDLVAAHGFRPADIESVECRVSPLAGSVLKYAIPQSPAEGKFSLPFCVAVATLHGDCGVRRFTQAFVDDDAVRSLAARVTLVVDPSMPRSGTTPSRMAVRLRDGSRFETRVETPKGSPERPFTTEELRVKFLECASASLPAAQANALFDRLLDLHSADDFAPIAALARTGAAKTTEAN